MKRLAKGMSVLIIVCMVFGAGVYVGSHNQVVTAQGGGQPEGTEQLFEPFWEAWNLVKVSFFQKDQITDEKLMQGAVRGLVQALNDERSAYLDPQAFESTLAGQGGEEYEGIGASVRKDTTTGGVIIVRTFDGSPAREKLREGDIIITVDGKDITPLSLTEAISFIRGPQGTSITLGILRRGEADLIYVDVQRAKIIEEIVSFRIYEGGIGYVSLTQFTDTSAQDVAKALAALDADNLNGLILDMRNDPGGPLASAINVASLFLPDGVIVKERGTRSRRDINYESTAAQLEASGLTTAMNVPMVVILNQASASASELVAGALQDRGRAKVVGTVSFGKGSIQTWNTLSDGSGLILTIANFLKPSEGVIDGIGIIPNVFVPWTEDQAQENPLYDPQLTEAILLLRGEF